MNRREFLESTAALATLAALSPANGAAESTRQKIKIGLLGASHSHATEKVKLLRASQDFELVGICEPDKEVRRPYEQAGIKLLSQRELLSECTVVATVRAYQSIPTQTGDAKHAHKAVPSGCMDMT